MATKETGAIYYKLKSDYDGDFTKNCSLLANEVDGNFHFLRGYDIASLEITKDGNIILKRIDESYDPLTININDAIPTPEEKPFEKTLFDFNKETGVLTITYPDKETVEISGFFVEGRDVRFATAESISGDGTLYSPLALEVTERTGTYAPAKKLIDLTDGSAMPTGDAKGYRVVTKELVDRFGMLYPFSAVEKLQKALDAKKSPWRVATKKDWDTLLNSLECKDEYKNHDSLKSGWLGKIAGQGLKSAELWDKAEDDGESETSAGVDIKGFSVLPVGRGSERNSIMGASDHDTEGFRKLAAFWVNTKDSNENPYIKEFAFNNAAVQQTVSAGEAKCSIRLVKEYDLNNYQEVENILGLFYPTVLIQETSQVWTKLNVYDSTDILGGVRSSEWEDASKEDSGIKTVFYINEWDGSAWHKKPMAEGDSVVIIDHDGKKYHEWRIINENLEDTTKAITDEFEGTVSSITTKLNELSGATQTISEHLEELSGVTASEIERATAKEEELSQAVAAEVERATGEEAKIKEAVENEVVRATDAENLLTKSIGKVAESVEAETARAKEQEGALLDKINDLGTQIGDDNIRINEVKAGLEAEVKRATDEEKAIKGSLDTEIADRKANDIVPKDYTLSSNETMELETAGEDVDNIKIKISDDFFNFGEF